VEASLAGVETESQFSREPTSIKISRHEHDREFRREWQISGHAMRQDHWRPVDRASGVRRPFSAFTCPPHGESPVRLQIGTWHESGEAHHQHAEVVSSTVHACCLSEAYAEARPLRCKLVMLKQRNMIAIIIIRSQSRKQQL